MSSIKDIRAEFEKIGEYYAAGLYEEPDMDLFVRYSRAHRRYLENCPLPRYNGEPLYPCGAIPKDLMVRPQFSYTVEVAWDRLKKANSELSDILYNELDLYHSLVPMEHRVGGNMYTHSYPNFKRILEEGLEGYEARVKKCSDANIREGLLDLLVGIRSYHSRILELLGAEASDSELYRALLHVPFKPARTIYEALVCWNFVYYLDGCDDIGALDADLIKYYNGEDVVDVLRCFFSNVDANDGWSGTLGPDYNPLTLQCLKAIKGFRRPSLELRIKPDMPEEIWNAAIESIAAGGGSPSLYNEGGYQTAIERIYPEMPKADRLRFAGGGCTETMFAGLSNIGSCSAGINIALVFERCMRKNLATSTTFDEFYNEYIRECRDEILKVLGLIIESQKLRAKYRPHPMRTLLVDDCIKKGRDFNNGGARYHGDVVSIAGMVNVIDSLLVIDHLVYKTKRLSGEEFLALLDNGENFLGYTEIPRHGVDRAESKEMAHRLSTDVTAPFSEVKPYFGGAFLPGSIQFITYAGSGAAIGATPDGRMAGGPLCDSIGAIYGNDKEGLTALLNSASSLNQQNMCGTPILNVKIDSSRMNKSLKALVLGYFENGGLQMQITCVNRQDLIRAKDHPEEYPNLIVRIGGYSEYFSRLSPYHRQSVIDRTEY